MKVLANYEIGTKIVAKYPWQSDYRDGEVYAYRKDSDQHYHRILFGLHCPHTGYLKNTVCILPGDKDWERFKHQQPIVIVSVAQ